MKKNIPLVTILLLCLLASNVWVAQAESDDLGVQQMSENQIFEEYWNAVDAFMVDKGRYPSWTVAEKAEFDLEWKIARFIENGHQFGNLNHNGFPQDGATDEEIRTLARQHLLDAGVPIEDISRTYEDVYYACVGDPENPTIATWTISYVSNEKACEGEHISGLVQLTPGDHTLITYNFMIFNGDGDLVKMYGE